MDIIHPHFWFLKGYDVKNPCWYDAKNPCILAVHTNSAINVPASGESITQQRKTAQSRNDVYIIRVLVDCFTAGKQLQHKLQVSAQQQHDTCCNKHKIHSLLSFHVYVHIFLLITQKRES